jgi:hypothetical protein
MATASDTYSLRVDNFWVQLETLQGKLRNILNIIYSNIAKKRAYRILSITDTPSVVNYKYCVSWEDEV